MVRNMTPPTGGGANHWGNHMGLPLRRNDFSIDNDKVSTYDTNINIRDQKDGISYGK